MTDCKKNREDYMKGQIGTKALKAFGGAGGVSKGYLSQNYMTMQQIYNSFASTYYETESYYDYSSAINIENLQIGDNIGVIDLSGVIVGAGGSGGNLMNNGILANIKGTPNEVGEYLRINISGNNSKISVFLQKLDNSDTVINEILLLSCSLSAGTSQYNGWATVSEISQKKNTQILNISGLSFGMITAISASYGNPAYAIRNGKIKLLPINEKPIAAQLVNLPFLRAKIGYEAEAEIELGEEGDYVSEPLWLRDGFVVRGLMGIITNYEWTLIRPVAADAISFNPADKTITVSAGADLTGWTARVRVVYDVDNGND
jgi:hypothetical protein